MFWIRYTTSSGTVETALQPAPVAVEYPDKRAQKVIQTADGAIVVQRAVRDPRPRKWKCGGYGPHHADFASLWARLESLEARARMQDGLPSSVELWEDVSGVGGFDRTDANGNRVYTEVTILQANRAPRQGGGPVIYESVLEFVVADPSYTTF